MRCVSQEVARLPSYNRLEVIGAYGTNKSDDVALAYSNADLSPSHPLKRRFAQNTHAVAADQIPTNSLVRQVYDSQVVSNFIADVLRCGKLYQFNDEFQSINLMYMHDNNYRAWHYDGSDAVITLMLQHADSGGEFEWCPFIRGF